MDMKIILDDILGNCMIHVFEKNKKLFKWKIYECLKNLWKYDLVSNDLAYVCMKITSKLSI